MNFSITRNQRRPKQEKRKAKQRNPHYNMKTIIMRTQKSSRWAAMLLATVVAIITCLAVANATQTITTPNAVKITYNLAAGGNSAAITPATNTSVLVMGCCTTVNPLVTGVGQVTLLHIPSTFMQWIGLESSTAAAIHDTSGAAGTHIVYIDGAHFVDIRVASPDTILIHNATNGVRTGNVTLVW
jgi:hypothetical protein